MNPYAKRDERKVGERRPKISHAPTAIDHRTKQQREADKKAVVDARRAIKKAARQELKRELKNELG